MALPYHVLKVCDGIVFAARGSNIHSFDSNFNPISVWKYPVKQQETNGEKAKSETPAPTVGAEESPAPEGPPAKKRKVEDGEVAAVTEETKEESKEETTEGQNETKSEGQTQEVNRRSRRQKQKQKTEGGWAKNNKAALEKPFVQGMYLTTDGHHLVAITGSDKTIWVFEHDGAGNLKQLSQRAMPKRPCALALTPDNKTILSADKFGDVFSLPLLFSPSEPTAAAAATTTSSE
ncbi:tRNA (guanine-N(7)-)-methyltransferase non-catalytic subunit trm82, partial [Neurospora sp. IMI 360204]